VQGEGAALDIARALQLFERSPVPVDVIIVGRGGGSIEDLWAFNEEPVARAIAAASVPIISAVGHEVDVTIADLVADLRAPTPSAAAEHAVPDGAALRMELAAARSRLARMLQHFAVRRREHLEVARERLDRRMHRIVEKRRDTVARLAARIDALSPLQSLARGYAVPLGSDGRILRRVGDFEDAGAFDLRVLDGTVHARTEHTDGQHDE
jgi:exodeoxyribonuclease VII large subunit